MGLTLQPTFTQEKNGSLFKKNLRGKKRRWSGWCMGEKKCQRDGGARTSRESQTTGTAPWLVRPGSRWDELLTVLGVGKTGRPCKKRTNKQTKSAVMFRINEMTWGHQGTRGGGRGQMQTMKPRARNCFSLLRIFGGFFCMDLKGSILKHSMRFQLPANFFFLFKGTQKSLQIKAKSRTSSWWRKAGAHGRVWKLSPGIETVEIPISKKK